MKTSSPSGPSTPQRSPLPSFLPDLLPVPRKDRLSYRKGSDEGSIKSAAQTFLCVKPVGSYRDWNLPSAHEHSPVTNWANWTFQHSCSTRWSGSLWPEKPDHALLRDPDYLQGKICEWLQWPKIHGHPGSSKYYCHHSFGANKEWMTNPGVWFYIDKVSGTKNPLSWYHVVFRDSICMSAMRPGVMGPSQVPNLSPSLIRGSVLFPSF